MVLMRRWCMVLYICPTVELAVTKTEGKWAIPDLLENAETIKTPTANSQHHKLGWKCLNPRQIHASLFPAG